MRKVHLTTWTQSDENPSVDLHVAIAPAEYTTDASKSSSTKFKVTAEGKVLTITALPGGSSPAIILAQWVLFDTVLSDVTWETKDAQQTLIINVTKTTMDVWKSCLRTPLSCEFGDVLCGSELDKLLCKEEQALTRPTTASTAVTEEDADAILEDVFKQANSHTGGEGDKEDRTSRAARELLVRESELNEIRLRHENEIKEEADAIERGDEAAVASTRKKLVLLKKMLDLGNEILELRYETPTIPNAIQVLQKEIAKLKYNRGEEECETEEFADETEQSMSADALYVQGIRLLDARKGLEGLHYLRLAAIRHSHPQAVMTLVRIYMEAGEQPKSFYLLLSKSLLGTSSFESLESHVDDANVIEPLVNFTTAQMFDNGVNFFRPFMALALYFYQRAAYMGESTAMTFAGQLFLRGGCIVSKSNPELVDVVRGLRWIHEGLDRGSLLAYKTMLELYLEGHLIPSNYDNAKRLYSNLYECSRDYLRQIPDVDARLDLLRMACNPSAGVASKVSNTNKNKALGSRHPASPEEDNDAVVELHPSTRLDGGSQRAGTASKRFARMEMESNQQRGVGSESTASSASRSRALTAQEVAESERKKRAMFRLTKVAVTTSFFYTLAFPLRVLALPYFYMAVENFLSLFRPRSSATSAAQPFGAARTFV